jgi:hypothetical protein
MAYVKTVTVVRNNHPDGKVTINESDMTADDVLFGENEAPKEGSKAWIIEQLKLLDVVYPTNGSKAELAEYLDDALGV